MHLHPDARWRKKPQYRAHPAWSRLAWYCVPVLCVALSPALAQDSLYSARQDHPYVLGSGWQVPATGLKLGGYASLAYTHFEGDSWRASLKDLSLFATWDVTSRWRAFTEFELGDGIQGGPGTIEQRQAELDLERFYVDYLATQTLTWRFGKFLTPIGRWNQVHADPLVWTVSRPLVTDAAFARHATGVMAYGTLGTHHGVLEYQVYADESRHLDPARDTGITEDKDLPERRFGAFDNAFGARVVWHRDDDQLQLGVSYANFRLNNRIGRKNLIGLDFTFTPGRAEFSGEFTFRRSGATTQNNEWGGFLQAVIPVVGNWYGVGRYEVFNSSLFDPVTHVHSLGVAFRPRPPLVFKLEYRAGEDNVELAPEGALASIAVLF